MKTILLFTLLAALATPVAAQSAFDGTWRAEVETAQIPDRPDTYLLQDGDYTCLSCEVVQTMPADGQFHPVTGNAYADALSVRVVDARTVAKTHRSGEAVVSEFIETISADGMERRVSYRSWANPEAPVVTGAYISRRVEAGPAGSHAASGSWQVVRFENISDEGTTFSMRIDGDTLHTSYPTGESYAARFGGPEAPVQGDPSGLVVSVTRPNPATIVETSKRDGEVIGVSTMSIQPGGDVLEVAYHDPSQGTTLRYVARKQ